MANTPAPAPGSLPALRPRPAGVQEILRALVWDAKQRINQAKAPNSSDKPVIAARDRELAREYRRLQKRIKQLDASFRKRGLSCSNTGHLEGRYEERTRLRALFEQSQAARHQTVQVLRTQALIDLMGRSADVARVYLLQLKLKMEKV